MLCKSCNKENEESAKFCKFCGEELYIHCQECGKEVPSTVEKCPHCGMYVIHKIDAPSLDEPTATMEQSKTPVVVSPYRVRFLVLSILGLVFSEIFLMNIIWNGIVAGKTKRERRQYRGDKMILAARIVSVVALIISIIAFIGAMLYIPIMIISAIIYGNDTGVFDSLFNSF